MNASFQSIERKGVDHCYAPIRKQERKMRKRDEKVGQRFGWLIMTDNDDDADIMDSLNWLRMQKQHELKQKYNFWLKMHTKKDDW